MKSERALIGQNKVQIENTISSLIWFLYVSGEVFWSLAGVSRNDQRKRNVFECTALYFLFLCNFKVIMYMNIQIDL